MNPSLSLKVGFDARTTHLIAHLLVTLAKLGTQGGLGAVAQKSLAVKHQLLITKRAQRHAPKLTSSEWLVLGVCALLAHPNA